MAAETDTFAPDLQADLPQTVLAPPLEAEPQARIRAERNKYQASLLKWLRQETPPASLQSMRDAVDAVLRCVPQDRQRAFWWVAGALLECLGLGGLENEQDARKLLGRIDLQMKSLAEGQPADTSITLREMLRLIARSQPVSASITTVKRVYALENLPAPTDAPPVSEGGALLEAMRALLDAAKENWRICARDAAVSPEFVAQLAQLSALAKRLKPGALQQLCRQMQAAATGANNSEQTLRLAPEMATSLLLLGSGLERRPDSGDEFAKQVNIADLRLQFALAGTAQDERNFAELTALQCRVEARSATAVLLAEIGADLQQAEQSFGCWSGIAAGTGQAPQPPVTQSPAETLAGLLRRAQYGLRFLEQIQSEPLLQALRQAVGHFAKGAAPARDEARPMAAALGALRAHVLGLLQPPAAQPGSARLDAALRDMVAMRLPDTEQATGHADAGLAQAAVEPPHGGDELLDVFLEEAREVLGNMGTNLEILRREPANREPLISIRRSFHTLKGSGRMVGLSDLAEAAWAIERAMNKWLLEKNRPVSQELIKLVLEAKAAFQDWVDELAVRGSTRVEAGELVTSARQIENALDAAPPSPSDRPVHAAQLAVPDAVSAQPAASGAEPAAIVIGTVTLSPALFGIATEEAAQHIAALLRYLADARASNHPAINYDFTRAAHTLAGVYRTMGFGCIAELAYALEQWLEQRIGQPLALAVAQLELLERAIAALQNMGTEVRQRREPLAQPGLIASLQTDRPISPAAVTETAEAPPAPVSPAKPLPAAAPEIAVSPPPLAGEERATRDDVDEQLLPIFLEEADDLYPLVGSNLRTWREQPDNKLLGRSLQRSLHTLKGSARMAGAMRLGELTHRMEDKVVQAMAQARLDAALWDELENYFDRIGAVVEQLSGKRPGGKAEAVAAAPPLDTPPPARTEAGPGAERSALAAMLRVRSDTVDRMVGESGEISVARSRIEAELREFKSGLLELTDSANHLRKQLREIEIQAEGQMQARIALARSSAEKFDPLEFDRFTRFQELTRFMNESVHDVQTVQQTLLKNLEEMAAALSGQARRNRELQQNLLAIRMVPFSSIAERLYRVVRQTGKELNKKANLELRGTGLDLDRSVLEKMTAPFEHLLRNSIAHGLEDPEQRKRAGKQPIGEIRLTLRQENNEVVFEFSDDGAGLDIGRLRRKAQDMGLLREGADAGDEQIVQMIFASGLTTAAEVSEVSGRGVGMDVVRSEIAALGGRIAAFSEQGNGVRFLIHLPLTLAASHVLMVRAGQELFAIPSAMAELVQQVKPAELDSIYHRGQVEWQGNAYPIRYLQHLLGRDESVPESRQYNRLLLLRSGEQRLALHVDELIGKQEAVVKNIGPQLAHLPGIAGATVLGNGSVVLIINPILLAQRDRSARSTATAIALEPAPAAPLVMVVDDSLTVRKITSRLLARAGYQVATARDGVDALEQLGELSPAVLLLDIEMPRMDGFELTQRLRQEPRTRNLPIIIISSRTADKHRDYARELGVNAYLGKPYQEKELLQQVGSFVALASASLGGEAISQP